MLNHNFNVPMRPRISVSLLLVIEIESNVYCSGLMKGVKPDAGDRSDEFLRCHFCPAAGSVS